MPRQSSGSYTPPANTSAISGQTISSSAFNTLETDIGAEITNSLDRLCRGGMQADLPMGGNKVSGLADPIGSQDAATKNYLQNYVSSTPNVIPNTSLAQAPAGSVKGVPATTATGTSAVTITIASPGVVTWTGHGLAANTPVLFTTTGALPTGLSPNVIYYVVGTSITTNTFSVSATSGGAAITTTGTQSGLHTAAAYGIANEQDLSFAYLGSRMAAGIPLPALVIGLVMGNNTATPDTKIDVAASFACIPAFGFGNAQHQSVALTINCTTTGANALDTGSLANSTWYYAYLISNGTTCAGLVSASSSAPTLPAGYLYFIRVGAVRTDSSAKFYRVLQKGSDTQYVVTASTNTPSMPVMSSTNPVGSVTAPTYVALSVSSYVPPTATRIRGIAGSASSTVIAAPNASYGATTATNPPPVLNNTNSIYATSAFDFELESTNIYYAMNGNFASNYCALYAFGWQDAVPCF